MKRYLLFGGYGMCPSVAGWYDFKGSYDTLEDAQRSWAQRNWDGHEWAHIVDSTTNAVVEKYCYW